MIIIEAGYYRILVNIHKYDKIIIQDGEDSIICYRVIKTITKEKDSIFEIVVDTFPGYIRVDDIILWVLKLYAWISRIVTKKNIKGTKYVCVTNDQVLKVFCICPYCSEKNSCFIDKYVIKCKTCGKKFLAL